MQTAMSAETVEISRTAGADGLSTNGNDLGGMRAIDAWDSASVKRLKKLIATVRQFPRPGNAAGNEQTNERTIMTGNSSALDSSFYIFNTHVDAEEAIRVLSHSGFDLGKLSLVGKGHHSDERPVGFYTMGDSIRSWGGIGAFWSGIWGLLPDSAVFLLPGVGMVAMAGPFTSVLVNALEGAVALGGLPVLGAALASSGVPMDQVIQCEVALKADRYILMVHGTVADKKAARAVLERAELPEESIAI